LEIRLKGCHFDTTEVVKAESQAVVLKTLIEHNFQGPSKINRSAENSAYTKKGTTSRVMVAGRPQVGF
jgi:23S rRNA maturation mini-RNase III